MNVNSPDKKPDETDFQNFPGPEAFVQHFPVLENATTKFQDFPGFSGPVRTLFRLLKPTMQK